MSQFGSPSHLVALIGTIVAAAVILPLARVRPGRWLSVLCVLLGAFLIVNQLGYEVVLVVKREWSAERALPCYLCDAAAFIAGLALITGNIRLAELTWFWAMAGTLQGLITPDQVLQFPSYDWLQFYGDHSGVVLAALILVIGRGLHPQPGAIPRVLAATVAFTVAAGVTDLITGGNYMYLRQVPGSGSLLSLMGPWPWYILATTGLALVLIAALDAPFWGERRVPSGRATADPPETRGDGYDVWRRPADVESPSDDESEPGTARPIGQRPARRNAGGGGLLPESGADRLPPRPARPGDHRPRP